MLEVYKDDAAIKAHQDSQHFKDFRPVVGDLLADRKVEVLQHGLRRQGQALRPLARGSPPPRGESRRASVQVPGYPETDHPVRRR